MQKENGDEYVRRIATFIRTHEQGLANAAIVSRRRAATSPAGSYSLLGWIGLGSAEQPKKSIFFTDDPHHLFYLLMRFEALGIDVGSLDVHVDNPSRPTSMSYLAMVALKDRSDTLSVTSFRSTMSAASVFSLGGSWFGRTEPPSLDADLKYLYSAFTKLPALRVKSSSVNVIAELADNPPTDSAVPMDAFKNLQFLECCDIDPRILLGWDQLSLGLKSLTIKRSGLEDITDLLIDCVIDDEKLRREGSSARIPRPKLVHHSTSARSLRPSVRSSRIPETVTENSEQTNESLPRDPSPERGLPSYAWSLLTHLSLADNNLTFLPSLPPFPSLLSLDLSSNLLVSVPPSLSTITTLKSLNLAHNMVDSVLGIYSQIPSITSLNISANRLDSLCGLERLEKLSRLDLRDNKVEDTDEIGRLAILVGMTEVWVSGNPCTLRDQDWRVRCFDLFAKENREIILDGSSPGLLERRSMHYHINKDVNSRSSNGRPLSQVHAPPKTSPNGTVRRSPTSSPKTTAVDQPSLKDPARMSPVPSITQNHTSTDGPAKHRRRKVKRIVDLDGKDSTDESGREALNSRPRHVRHRSDPDLLRQQLNAEQNTPGPSNPNPTSIPSQELEKAVSPGSGELRFGVAANSIPPLNRPMTIESSASISGTRQSIGASQTLSSTKSAKRRARISPSMYEPSSPTSEFPGRGHERGPSEGGQLHSEAADLFRMRMEALRNEVGDSWLKVLSQSQFGSPEGTILQHKS